MKNTLSTERKTGKVLLSLIVAVFAMMLMLTVSLTSSAENIANGTCGDNLTWVLDDEGTLTIDGEGDMDNFSSYSTPWISYRDKIMNVIIGNDVTSIGGQAFENCYGLSSISIGSSVKSIGFRAFYTCSSLKELVMPNSVTDIGNTMCYRCGNLEKIVLSENLSSISELAFYECYKLNNVIIPKSVTSIERSAFWYCTNLTSIIIPDSVISLKDSAFKLCSSLSDVTIGKGIEEIGSDAFSSCKALVKVTIPETVKTIGSGAFMDCSALEELTISDGVTTIGDSAFRSCYALNNITIPNSVTSIGDTSFQWCKKVTNITIGKGLSNIGNQAFYGCGNILTNIVVDEENKTFDSRDNCNAIIETESNTLLIGSNSTTIPKSVTTIADNAFYDCNIVTNVVIPNNITDIGISAFQSCDNLSEVTLTESIKSISNNLFYLCGKLSGISIPDNVTSIGKNSFAYTALKSISISANVTFIGTYAFGACKNLTEVTIDKENRIYDNRDNCNAIIETESNTIIAGFNNTEIPYSVTKIGDYAFCNYNFIAIPNSITSIGNYAYGFDGMRDLYITIPDSVINIDKNAFSGMTHDYSRIYGYEGSAAQSYANERNIPFVILDKGCQHSETKNVGAYEASCRLSGYTGNLCCVSCGKIIEKGEVIAPTDDHVFGELKTETDSTCLHYGIGKRACSECGYFETELIDPKGHIDEDSDGFCDRCGRGGTELTNDISYDTYWLVYKNPYKDDPDHIYDGLLYNKNDNTINLYLTDRDMPYIKYHPDTNTFDPKSAYITELYESGFYDEEEIEYWISEELTFWEGYINPPMPKCDWMTVYDINDKTKDFCTCLDWTCDWTDIVEESVSAQAFISENEDYIYLVTTDTEEGDVYKFLIKKDSPLYEFIALFTAPSGHDFTGTMVSNHDGTHSFECVNGCGQTGATVSCSYGAWKTVTASTCTVKGTEERVCACTAKETRELPLVEHKDSDNDGCCDDCGKELSDGSGDNKQRKFPPCQNIISNFCDVYNEYADIPVLNVIFYIIHFFIHLAR